jgi:UbiD family decarboxylase
MEFSDLREFIDICKEIGEERTVENADWDLEIGAITELTAEIRGPLLLFDKIKGYPPGFRVCSNMYSNLKRTAIALNLPQGLNYIETLTAWRNKMRHLKPIPSVEVDDAPIKENVITGDDIDIYKFPAPRWHDGDGGRYIGTGHAVITRDPDEGWVNMGTYRVMVQSKNSVSVVPIHGQHGRFMMDKYHARGQNCPVAICFGPEPALFLTSTYRVPWGMGEYEFAGGIKGSPIEVTKGMFTDLPLPARGEIVIEGEIPPLNVASCAEGPFGEWPGYLTATFDEERPLAPLIKVKSVFYRNDPIISSAAPLKPPTPCYFDLPLLTAGSIWDQLEAAGFVGIKGVWSMVTMGALLTVVCIKQMYQGHAKEVGIAASVMPGGVNQGNFTIVVDDDIDITNIEDVLWALATRCNVENIEIIRGIHAGMTHPLGKPQLKKGKFPVTSRAIIDACKPYDWIDEFPKVNIFDPEYRSQIADKWDIPNPKARRAPA